jgi:hypothetical protein
MKNILGFAGVLLLATVGSAQENYSTSWTQHKNLYIHTGANRANVTANVTNFPLLVRLNSTNFGTGFAQAKGNGADIRFTKTGNVVRLKHQIETWDSAGKTATIWVLIDTVKASLNNQTFMMHWGNAAAADSSKGSAVFDTANGFVAVWHLNETTTAAGQVINDATVNANHGKLGLQGTGVAPVNTTTMIGIGKSFTGGSLTSTNTNGAYYSIKDSATTALQSLNTASGAFTITAWANPEACGTGNTRSTIISKYDNNNTTGTRAWALQMSATAAAWRFTANPNLDAFKSATTGNEFVADNTCTVGQWDYLAARYSATAPVPGDAASVTMGLSLNGEAEVVASTADQGTGSSIGPDGYVFIGRLMSAANANNRFLRGAVDEIQVSKVRRSDAWVKLSYETQKATSTAVTDAVVSILPGAGSTNGFAVSQMAGSLQFRLPANVGGNAVVTVSDMQGRAVWNRTVSTGSSESVVSWNGVTASGSQATAGLYAVTVSLRDASGADVRTLSQKVSFAR